MLYMFMWTLYMYFDQLQLMYIIISVHVFSWSTLYLISLLFPQGDSAILTIEYVEDTAPFLFQGATFSCGGPHQAVAFLPKTLCDVSKVEVARGVRQCKTSIEPFLFRIPRVKVHSTVQYYNITHIHVPTHVNCACVYYTSEGFWTLHFDRKIFSFWLMCI